MVAGHHKEPPFVKPGSGEQVIKKEGCLPVLFCLATVDNIAGDHNQIRYAPLFAELLHRGNKRTKNHLLVVASPQAEVQIRNMQPGESRVELTRDFQCLLISLCRFCHLVQHGLNGQKLTRKFAPLGQKISILNLSSRGLYRSPFHLALQTPLLRAFGWCGSLAFFDRQSNMLKQRLQAQQGIHPVLLL